MTTLLCKLFNCFCCFATREHRRTVIRVFFFFFSLFLRCFSLFFLSERIFFFSSLLSFLNSFSFLYIFIEFFFAESLISSTFLSLLEWTTSNLFFLSSFSLSSPSLSPPVKKSWSHVRTSSTHQNLSLRTFQ